MDSNKLLVNTLVTHIKKPEIAIGVIAKKLKVSYKVNFGLNDVVICKPTDLKQVDVSETSTITFQEYKSRILKVNSKLSHVIVGNEVMHYVGIGWISIGVVTLKDLKLYPRVIF